ncbi:MAG: pyrroloquinoline quinone biosynthesis protein PqqB [Gammaproteobacteria bacterium]|nr:pyrroloquinoline quinone biosynthesis protein PqqB [Gammaproteobacteria bacterium]
MIRVLVLGAAAGGGFPQWNSNSEASRRARAGDPAALPATQASIAVSADGKRWFIVNAAPDLRQQIGREPLLHPRAGLRSSPISGVILTNGDVDAISGLLHLRERTAFTVLAHPRILAVLEANPIFGVLSGDVVGREPLSLGERRPLRGPAGEETGLMVEAFEVPGKVALYLEDKAKGGDFGTEAGDTVGLEITQEDGSARLVYIANCAAVDARIRGRVAGADLLFFDGTLWRDDEMIRSGEGTKTGSRMGHVSMSGPRGAIESLRDVAVGRRIFIHVNNTNPALLADSDERKELEACGWEVAYDGMEIHLP